MTRALAPLVEIHHRLDDVFAHVRELVLVGDGRRAAALLDVFHGLTARHAADEEARLVPRLDATARWPAELYFGQHVKLLAAIGRLRAPVAAVDRATPGWRRAALVALDAAAPVLHLAEHHHLAEEQDLFVHAAATAPALIDELAARWRADLDGARGALDDAIAALAAAP